MKSKTLKWQMTGFPGQKYGNSTLLTGFPDTPVRGRGKHYTQTYDSVYFTFGFIVSVLNSRPDMHDRLQDTFLIPASCRDLVFRLESNEFRHSASGKHVSPYNIIFKLSWTKVISISNDLINSFFRRPISEGFVEFWIQPNSRPQGLLWQLT